MAQPLTFTNFQQVGENWVGTEKTNANSKSKLTFKFESNRQPRYRVVRDAETPTMSIEF